MPVLLESNSRCSKSRPKVYRYERTDLTVVGKKRGKSSGFRGRIKFVGDTKPAQSCDKTSERVGGIGVKFGISENGGREMVGKGSAKVQINKRTVILPTYSSGI